MAAPAASDLKKVQADIQSAKLRIEKTQGQQNAMQETLKKTESEINAIEQNVRSLNHILTRQQENLKKLAREEVQLEKDRQVQEKAIEAQINASYRLGKEKTLKLILNQDAPEKISRSLAYAGYVNRYRMNAMQDMQKTLDNIKTNKEATAKEKAALLDNKNEFDKKKQQLKKTQSVRQEQLAKLGQVVKSEESKLAQLMREQAQLQELLRSVKKATANVSYSTEGLAFAKTQGKLRWPTKGRLDNRFGKSRQSGSMLWEGVAFMASKGTPVQAVHNGNVVFSEWFPGKGLLIIIDHGNGYMTLYAHNETILHKAGDSVKAGDIIATVGDSGGLPKAELYFEIRHQGQPVNPANWLNNNG